MKTLTAISLIGILIGLFGMALSLLISSLDLSLKRLDYCVWIGAFFGVLGVLSAILLFISTLLNLPN